MKNECEKMIEENSIKEGILALGGKGDGGGMMSSSIWIERKRQEENKREEKSET